MPLGQTQHCHGSRSSRNSGGNNSELQAAATTIKPCVQILGKFLIHRPMGPKWNRSRPIAIAIASWRNESAATHGDWRPFTMEHAQCPQYPFFLPSLFLSSALLYWHCPVAQFSRVLETTVLSGATTTSIGAVINCIAAAHFRFQLLILNSARR